MDERANSEDNFGCEGFDAETWVTDFEEVGGKCYIDRKTGSVLIMVQTIGYAEKDRLRAKELEEGLLDGVEDEKRLAAIEKVVKRRSSQRYDNHWPDQPDASIMVAMLYQRLGGNFSISGDGRRLIGSPLAGFYDRLSQIPQLPGSAHRHRFESEAEWSGAMKLLGYCIEHSSKADRDLVFDVFAPIAIDDRTPFDFRERLQ